MLSPNKTWLFSFGGGIDIYVSKFGEKSSSCVPYMFDYGKDFDYKSKISPLRKGKTLEQLLSEMEEEYGTDSKKKGQPKDQFLVDRIIVLEMKE
ncbi:hypothetical protein QTN25_006848 [Entamoeba marina]